MKNCSQCHTGFEVTDSDRAFYEKVSPVFGGQKYLFPEPTLCPDCRQQQRLLWRNERNLYRRPCDLCKSPMIAMYAPESPYTVYCQKCWWSDRWDALKYGRDFDFSRPFFEQFRELAQAVPHVNLLNFEAVENCEYTNFCNESRNIYLCFGAGWMEDCQYLDWVYYAKNTFDCSYCQKSEMDYMNVDCSQTYHSRFCDDCHGVSDCAHCFDCRNCKNCFGCVGLRNKEYHLFNKPYSKKDYEELTARLRDPKFRQNIADEVAALKAVHPRPAVRIIASEGCTGYDIENSKNCVECFGIKDCQDCKFNFDALQNKDAMDNNRTGVTELGLELCAGGYHHDLQFGVLSASISFGRYVLECMYSKNLFGSVGINHKDYVFFNKQYSKEEFDKIAGRIAAHMQETGEWGQFFPSALSPFAYNETLAHEFFPLSESEAVGKGFRWRPKDRQEYLPPQGDILACEVTGRNFKLTPQEIRFYQQEGLPQPTKHPNQRYAERLARKLPRRLFDRTCAQCQTPIKTPYAPERPEMVVCEACYLKAVY